MNNKFPRIIAALLMSWLISGFARAGGPDSIKQLEAKTWTAPSVGMTLRRIPPGTFTMGSHKDEMARGNDETPHKVTISRPFYIGVYEVRQGEFYKLMMPDDYDYDAWTFKRGPLHDGAAWAFRWYDTHHIIHGKNATTEKPVTKTCPITPVSWHRAMTFCKKLTQAEREAGRLPKGYVYRLPTEAEWEYACRAGTSGPYSFEGPYDEAKTIKSHIAFPLGGGWTLGPVDTKSNRKPNPWGLQDMHGNVYEWCLDWYGPYDPSATKDPPGPESGEERVARGGCLAWADPKNYEEQIHPFCRSASRYGFPPDTDYQILLGFRVVLAPAMAE